MMHPLCVHRADIPAKPLDRLTTHTGSQSTSASLPFPGGRSTARPVLTRCGANPDPPSPGGKRQAETTLTTAAPPASCVPIIILPRKDRRVGASSFIRSCPPKFPLASMPQSAPSGYRAAAAQRPPAPPRRRAPRSIGGRPSSCRVTPLFDRQHVLRQIVDFFFVQGLFRHLGIGD